MPTNEGRSVISTVVTGNTKPKSTERENGKGRDCVVVFVDECVRKSLNKLAQSMIMESLHFSSPLLPYSCFGKDICYTCGQVVTPTEVQYVCSGCRVACYCSIEHQRMTWKKEAMRGMRIGHEILCPLYKAYRKLAHARESRDKEKESRMKRRFDRECVRFLADGLGLKDKCFPCEYQSMS